MKALILVGGEGTRLRPLTHRTVKPMVPVVNRPFLEHLFGYLGKHGILDIVLATGYKPEQIEHYFGNGEGFGIHIGYSVESRPLGTAGAVKNAETFLDDTFLVLNGDVLGSVDLAEMLRFHTEKKAIATLALTEVDDPSAFGVVLTDSSNRVTSFIEKPKREEAPSNLINAGVYILEPEVLDYITNKTFCMFERDVFPVLLQEQMPVYAFISDGYWLDMGTPEKYLKLQEDILYGKAGEFSISLADGFEIGGGTTINRTATIKTPVIIGKNSNIGSEVFLEGPSVVGNECHIGQGARITGSILWDRVSIGQNAQIQGSIVSDCCIIGEKVILGSGSVIGSGAIINNIIIPPGSRIEPDTKLDGNMS